MTLMTQVPARARRPYRISLPAGSAATMAARRHVWALIHAWDVPLDAYTAALLTSELVADVISADPGAAVELMISWVDRKFCVEVRDASRSTMAGEDPADAPAGAGPARDPADGADDLVLVVNARRNLHFWYWPGQDR
jgi:hypothetical protein